MIRTEEISLPLPDEAPIPHPEMAVLTWSGFERALFVGQICYLSRDTRHKGRSLPTFRQETISLDRRRLTRSLIRYLSDQKVISGERPATNHNRAAIVVRFFNYVDETGITTRPSDKRTYELAFAEYSKHLRERISTNSLHKNTASEYQQQVRDFFNEHFGPSPFAPDVQIIRYSKRRINHTVVPGDSEQGEALTCYEKLFNLLHNKLVGFKPYPFSTVLWDSSTESSKPVWFLPSAARPSKAEQIAPFDPLLERALSATELGAKYRDAGYNRPSQRGYAAWRSFDSQLSITNANKRARSRLSHAAMAMQCFAGSFMAETGVNLAQLRSLPWSKKLDAALLAPEISHQNFREIKYRAKRRVVSFTVSTGFIPKLKKYLELRKYFLGSQKHSSLFLAIRSDGRSARNLPRNFLAPLHSRFESLGILVRQLTAQEWRAARQHWTIANHGPDVAAKVMNQTLETTLKSYSNGTDVAHRQELGIFLSSLETVITTRGRVRDETESALGSCAKFGAPRPLSPTIPVKPDCKSAEGCLFCDKYRLHADEVDIRKIFSCRHCIKVIGGRALSLHEFEITFGLVMRRIEFFITQLRASMPDLVREIEIDVDVMGNLDQFWSAKLDQLIELELT